MSLVRYRVIEILNAYSILINYGFDNGAKENDMVRIISTGPEIKDPETGEVLGTLDFIKDTLTITTVYEKFSLCNKIETIVTNALISPLSMFEKTHSEIKALNVLKESISEKLTPNDKIIKIGDIVEIL